MKVLALLALVACVVAAVANITEDDLPALVNNSTVPFELIQSKWELLNAQKENTTETKKPKPTKTRKPKPKKTRKPKPPKPTEPDPFSLLEYNWPVLRNNDYFEHGCRDVMLFWARGSGQLGNMGKKPGPFLAKLLRDHYGFTNVTVQGLNYGAYIVSNLKKLGTDKKAISKLKQYLSEAALVCEHSKIIVSGYSQGAAVVHGAFMTLDEEVLRRIDGVVLFGDTRAKITNSTVANFPHNKTLSICNKLDKVCQKGRLVLTDSHINYQNRSAEAADFIIKMLHDVPSKHGHFPIPPLPPVPVHNP